MHLKVRKKNGEEIRNKLLKMDALDNMRRVQSDDEYIYFPLKKKMVLPSTTIVEKEGLAKKHKPRSLRESLEGRLPDELMNNLPKSFDLIGDIALLEIPAPLLNKKTIIGDALLNSFKNIKVVARKKTLIKTRYRTREVEVLAGENRTKTTHREHGCIYLVDIKSAYFSPRLSHERMRVAEQVSEGERVLVMFAGVGPYAILIAKKRNPKKVVAVELNPEAAEYMKKNVALNKVKVDVIEGDVRDITPKLGLFDRIIMPLPKDAGDFLDVTLPALDEGGTVHYYDFAADETESKKKLDNKTKKLGYKIKILDSVKCGSYSPNLYRTCVDFKL
ncbi:MAG: hypothetical protein B6U97_00400 [Candidatus Altiarchaeales archaeon ex4484_96]|nr:MAG: hypothetical protein B6U97_00400 [Candidatus Altiarchaeales archaeon ex4484_96]